MDKRKRQGEILRLIRESDVASQEDLRKALKKDGMEVTQATLSRDLKELGVVKAVGARGTYKYSVPGKSTRLIQRMDASGNLVVVKTEAGTAAAAAYRVDALNDPLILGSVAGEDTVLVVLSEDADAERAKELIWEAVER
ncbi:MAG TPA: arginine repressor [Acidobacteriota bacterium]|nr:arginine repressor [Acidobacteriota bacterium]